jgi:hypothetical protein
VILEGFLDVQLSIEIFSIEKAILGLARSLQEKKAVLNVQVLATLDKRLTDIIASDPRFRKYLEKGIPSFLSSLDPFYHSYCSAFRSQIQGF